MKHIRRISANRPALCQFDPVFQLIMVIQSILGLYQQITDLFGIPVPQKSDDNAGR